MSMPRHGWAFLQVAIVVLAVFSWLTLVGLPWTGFASPEDSIVWGLFEDLMRLRIPVCLMIWIAAGIIVWRWALWMRGR